MRILIFPSKIWAQKCALYTAKYGKSEESRQSPGLQGRRPASCRGEPSESARAGTITAATRLLPHYTRPHGRILATNYIVACLLLLLMWLLHHSSLIALLLPSRRMAESPFPTSCTMALPPHSSLLATWLLSSWLPALSLNPDLEPPV